MLKRVLAACLLWPLAVPAEPVPPQWGMAVHGGAGSSKPASYSEQERAAMQEALAEALRAGHAVLAGGGASVDAVQAAIRVLEDDPHFNAGRGAVFTHEGKNELDASIMDGASGKAGAVAGVTRIRNPIDLARRVMDASPHVMLAGAGAEAFARAQGFSLVDPAWFRTEKRWQQLQRALDPRAAGLPERYLGTVGAVALDRRGHLAAGTSTGGMTNKRHGRVGDSPIIGAGTYARDGVCAVSATGHGEFFIRGAVAYDICARVKYLRQPIAAAAGEAIEELKAIGGDGGVIAIDAQGQIAMPFNTPAMARGTVDAQGRIRLAFTHVDAAVR